MSLQIERALIVGMCAVAMFLSISGAYLSAGIGISQWREGTISFWFFACCMIFAAFLVLEAIFMVWLVRCMFSTRHHANSHGERS